MLLILSLFSGGSRSQEAGGLSNSPKVPLLLSGRTVARAWAFILTSWVSLLGVLPAGLPAFLPFFLHPRGSWSFGLLRAKGNEHENFAVPRCVWKKGAYIWVLICAGGFVVLGLSSRVLHVQAFPSVVASCMLPVESSKSSIFLFQASISPWG